MAMPMHALASLTRSSALIRPWRGGGGLGGGVVGRCFSAAPRKRDVALIRELREASGAPMVDCKKALTVSSQCAFAPFIVEGEGVRIG